MERVSFEEAGDGLLVVPHYELLDAGVAREFADAASARARGHRRVLVSLRDVSSMDASGLAALVVLLKRLPAGGQLWLTDVDAPVRALLEATGLDDLLPIVELPVGRRVDPGGAREAVLAT